MFISSSLRFSMSFYVTFSYYATNTNTNTNTNATWIVCIIGTKSGIGIVPLENHGRYMYFSMNVPVWMYL